MNKFEIQTQFIYGWENVWQCEGELEYFDTYQQARKALDEFLNDMDEAFYGGEINEPYDGADYRIRKVK